MNNWHKINEDSELQEFIDASDIKSDDLLNGLDITLIDLLTDSIVYTTQEILDAADEDYQTFIEWIAESYNLVDSEEALSERFDSEIMPLILEQHSAPGEAFEDQCLIDQAFNDWTDSLCKDGEIHELQYDQYTYTGKWCDV